MIAVQVVNAHGRRRVRRKRLGSAVRSVLKGEGVRHAAIGVVCINDRACRRLNRTFLGHDHVTDVISFPIETRPHLEGEVYVNLDRAHLQAREYNVSPSHEIARLVIHGTLHLAGYEDRTPVLARRMHLREDAYLARLFGGRRLQGTV